MPTTVDGLIAAVQNSYPLTEVLGIEAIAAGVFFAESLENS
jgi:hypothetical protein